MYLGYWITNYSTYDVESIIEDDIQRNSSLRPCHPGPLMIHLRTDAIEYSIQGQLACTCARSIATFSGAVDGIDNDLSPVLTPRHPHHPAMYGFQPPL